MTSNIYKHVIGFKFVYAVLLIHYFIQLDTIAKIFIHQLTEARHRGAFEMAYSGFSKLCRCLWTSSSPDLNQKPQKWVLDLLESLQSTSLARLLSITRRSAGLPFYLQVYIIHGVQMLVPYTHTCTHVILYYCVCVCCRQFLLQSQPTLDEFASNPPWKHY